MIRAFNSVSGDNGGPILDISADLGLKLDASLDEIMKYVKWKAWQERTFERYLSRPFGFLLPQTPAPGVTQVAVAYDVGGPSEGRIWQVDRLVADVAPLGAARPAGVTIALATAPGERQGETIVLRPDSMFWRGTNTEWARVGYPSEEDWGSRQLVVQPLDHLFVLAVQPSTGAQEHQVAGRLQVTDLVYHEEHRHAAAVGQF